MFMFWIVFGIGVAGLILLGVSNIMYFSRTKDKPFQRFWLGKDILTNGEYITNRVGFALALTSIFLMVGIFLIYWMRFV